MHFHSKFIPIPLQFCNYILDILHFLCYNTPYTKKSKTEIYQKDR